MDYSVHMMVNAEHQQMVRSLPATTIGLPIPMDLPSENRLYLFNKVIQVHGEKSQSQ